MQQIKCYTSDFTLEKLQIEFTTNDPISFIWIYLRSIVMTASWNVRISSYRCNGMIKTHKSSGERWQKKTTTKWILCSHHWTEHCFTTESSLNFKISLHVYLFAACVLLFHFISFHFCTFQMGCNTLYTGTCDWKIQYKFIERLWVISVSGEMAVCQAIKLLRHTTTNVFAIDFEM